MMMMIIIIITATTTTTTTRVQENFTLEEAMKRSGGIVLVFL
jgi:hypothetical protein